ncbi:NAD(P)/FAD-dependent oxidoreductase [Candidatus Saccharibacteria bacterium]|nr:NAD(P)/FAD-dependent oxidoreductase [Candidatus Saccharibacteria bacterium]
MARPHYDYDLIVIGSGAGGSVAATIANAAGKRVAMVEAGTLGGECPNWGCIPTKAMIHIADIYAQAKDAAQYGLRSGAMGYNYPSIRAWKDTVVRRTGAASSQSYYEGLGIDIVRGQAHFLGKNEISVNRTHYTAEHFVVASGTRTFVPDIQGLQETGYLTNKEALELNRPPKTLAIIGGGAIGVEFAQLFATFGTKVHIIDISPRLLPNEDGEISALIERVFKRKYGMQLTMNARVTMVEKEGLGKRVTYEVGGETHSFKTDEVMVATGKLAMTDFGLENAGIEYAPRNIFVNEHLRTSTPNIYGVGDVVGPYMFTHMAIYQGKIAAHNILHPKKPIATDYRAVPRCIFITPEVASVGMTEEECIKRAFDYKKALAPLSIISRANIENNSDGFVKVLTDNKGVLIGASIAAPHAGEMIHELALAVQLGLKASDVAGVIHAYPTWSEAVRVACAKIQA